uniref:EGF-like domain-containing protein n=1 Tax=Strongyloides papillosus TaxID=174720 RepID=A0A0N5BG48_STREA
MSKLLYLFLVWVGSICIFVKYIEGQESSFRLDYTIGEVKKSVNGTKDEPKKYKNETVVKEVFLFKLPLPDNFDEFGNPGSTEIKFFYNEQEISEIRLPEVSSKNFVLKEANVNVTSCSLKNCAMGALFYKNISGALPGPPDFPKFHKIFYVAYEATEKYKFLFLKFLGNFNHKDKLNVIACPHETWISEHSLLEYIADKNNIIPFPEKNESDKYYYYYKLNHYQNTSSEIALKCGHIKQRNMPPIDVGYACCSKQKSELGLRSLIFPNYLNKKSLTIDSNNVLSDDEHGSLLNSSLIAYYILSPDNNFNSNSIVFGRYNSNSKLYSGQSVLALDKDDYKIFSILINSGDNENTYYFHSQFLVPNIKATLRLKVNGVVQEFKTAKNSESMDTYTVDLGGMNNGLVGCHAVPDNITHPGFKDFYEKRYRTELFVIDKNTNMSIKVNDTKSLVANSTYKCALYNGTTNYKNLTEKYIKETKFTIHLVEPINSNKSTDSTKSKSTIWIIVGVSVGAVLIITLLLLAGLIFYKKRLLKKKGSKSSLSSRKSQPISKSSSVIENDFNVSMIQKKATNAGSKNIVKSKIVLNANPNMSNQNENRSKEISS